MTNAHLFLAAGRAVHGDSGFLVAGIIALIAVGFVFSIIAHIKRKKELEAWAKANGLTFSTGRTKVKPERLFDCLQRGHDRYASMMMAGKIDDWVVRAFDYHYETYSTDSKGRRQTHHHHFSAVLIDSKFPLKHLYIRPEGFFDKVTEFVGVDDIDFESAEFSRKFYVKAKDRRWAYDVITQDTMAFMLENARGFKIQFAVNCALIWVDRRMKAEQFSQAFAALTGILSRIPEHVQRERLAPASLE
jgi:hypothetical protein